MNTCLSIAGSDPSGGAGIQADLKTFAAMSVYGMSVITALTAQNTTGVQGIYPVPAEFLQMQLDSVFSDIPPDAVKIGMIPDAEGIEVIAHVLKKYGAANVVLDPVMISTSGSVLITDEAKDALCEKVIDLAKLITPNIPEAEALTGIEIKTTDDMMHAASMLNKKYSCSVLVKGGHLKGNNDAPCVDVLLENKKEPVVLSEERIDNPNTHGTGCTLSSAIAAGLANEKDLDLAVREAKEYVTGAIAAGLDIGKGCGPLDHGWRLRV